MRPQKYNNELARLRRLDAELPGKSIVTAFDNFSRALSGLSAAIGEAAKAAGKMRLKRRRRTQP